MKAGTATAETAEFAEARKRIRELDEEVKILRKAAAAVEKVVPPKSVTASGKTALLVRLTKLLAGTSGGAVPVAVRLRDAREGLDFAELAREKFIADLQSSILYDNEGHSLRGPATSTPGSISRWLRSTTT